MANGRVLIVDNEPSVLKSYALSPGKAGFSVTKASSGREALQYIEREEFDVVLSDFSMPQMDGLALLSSMRARSVDLPVVLMLDKVDNRTMLKAAELGAMQALVKPIAPELLRETARFVVQRWRSRHTGPAEFVHRRGTLETVSSKGRSGDGKHATSRLRQNGRSRFWRPRSNFRPFSGIISTALAIFRDRDGKSIL